MCDKIKSIFFSNSLQLTQLKLLVYKNFTLAQYFPANCSVNLKHKSDWQLIRLY